MANFSLILQDPQVRAVVQEGMLEKAFHDALFPLLLFRGEAIVKKWPGNVGDTPVFSAPGLIKPNLLPILPGTDPLPSTYGFEQWSTVIQKYPFATMDTDMPTSMVAIINLFLRNCQQLGLQAGQSTNRIARNYMFNASLAGNTVATSAVTSTTIPVARLNGLTTARRPDLPAGSPAQFAPVSASNPLPVTVFNGGSGAAANIVGFSPATAGDIYGPGTITLDTSQTVSLRGSILTGDRTNLIYAGAPAGTNVDAINSAAFTLTLALIRSAVARMRSQNVPVHPDGRFHCHFDPIAEAEVFADPENQRLLQSLPDYYMYREFALGEIQGTVFYRNTENPQPGTVNGGLTDSYDPTDYFGGELYTTGSTAGLQLHYTLFTGQGGLYEYWVDQAALITEAGIAGRTGDFKITNNGIEVYTDRVKLILREALNRTQDMVSATSLFFGGWTFRTDVLTGDAARIKRAVSVISA